MQPTPRPLRCFLAATQWGEKPIRLERAEAHYLQDVRRVRTGDRIELFDGQGRTARAVIEHLAADHALVSPSAPVMHPAPRPALWLVQALPKAQKMDWIVQKCTELGASRIVPVTTANVVVQVDAKRARRKVERWRAIALNAVRQCGASWIPHLDEVTGLAAFLASRPQDGVLLVADLAPHSEPLRDRLRELRLNPPGSVACLVGPEGDFTDAERDSLRKAGAVPVSLGPDVLRTETAALYAVGALRYEFR